MILLIVNFVSFLPREKDTFVGKKWRQLVVGDILKVGCDEMFPADLLLLQSSDISGSCHVSTANLDGENNLKQKQLPKGFADVRSLLNFNYFHVRYYVELHSNLDLICVNEIFLLTFGLFLLSVSDFFRSDFFLLE